MDLFKTSDLPTAAALYALGFIWDSSDRSDPRRCIFEYKKTKELTTTLKKLEKRTVLLEPYKYFESVSACKRYIYEPTIS